ncbi:MAG: efflux transporter periplasmic adaptor subunit [Rhodobacterales bacterium]|nr:MAG: efflux transporter periplasmic adaptor subunit [Rhodobacterales bacterium]
MQKTAGIAPVLAAFALAVIAGQAALSQDNPVSALAEGYRTAPVMVSQVGGSAIVGGTVIPYKEITVAAQVPGRITYLAGSEGHRAKTGEMLVRIDDADLRAKRRAAESQVRQAEAALRNSYMQYSREIYSPRVNSVTGVPGMGIPATFDQFFTQGFSEMMGQSDSGVERHADLYAQGIGVETATSGLAAAQANLDAIDATLKDFQATAEFDGIIMRKHVEVGDTVQPGMPIIDFAFIDYLRIEADVPVRLAAGLAEGMLVPARLDSGGGPVEARVAQIYPVADARRHTVTVKFDLPIGTPGGPGMYAEVTVPDASVPTSGQTSVPAEALIWRGSLPAVFVLDQGVPSLRIVRVGYPLADGSISVVSGLSGGETVILSPPSSLISGH